MFLSSLDMHIELCTRRLELADQALLATAAGNYELADQCDREIEEITRQLKNINLDEAEIVYIPVYTPEELARRVRAGEEF